MFSLTNNAANYKYSKFRQLTFYRVTIPEAAYIQLRRRPPEDEKGNARNMQRILINVLHVNKQEFGASSQRSTKAIHSGVSGYS